MGMDAKARRALDVIRGCVAAGRYLVLPHFVERMHGRGFFWPDVLALIEGPADVRSDGRDEFDRPKWVVAGKGADGVAVEVVCVLDTDDRGRVTIFITVY